MIRKVDYPKLGSSKSNTGAGYSAVRLLVVGIVSLALQMVCLKLKSSSFSYSGISAWRVILFCNSQQTGSAQG